MKKTIIRFTLGLVIGALCMYLASPVLAWRTIEKAKDLSFAESDGEGLRSMDAPKIDGALGLLVDSGELHYSTFVIPSANNPENVKRWMSNDSFVWAVGPVHADGLKPTSASDLIYTAWHRTRDWERVRQFAAEFLSDKFDEAAQQVNSADAASRRP